MSFQPGDIVWVPFSTPNTNNSNNNYQYWPAKFFKQTNRPDICIVLLYSTNLIQEHQQFLVDTEEILAFECHEIKNGGVDIIKAYQKALKDYKQKNNPKQNQMQIETANQLCKYIENIVFNQYIILSKSQNSKQKTIQPIPRFKQQKIPVSLKDLKLYFNRKIPHMINYLLETGTVKQSNLIIFLREVKNKMQAEIIKAVQNQTFIDLNIQ